MADGYYIPGACNINPAEVSFRKKASYYFGLIGLALLASLIVFDALPILGVTIFVPAWITALQYLQSKYKFCVRFAAKGKFSSGVGYGAIEKVLSKSDQVLDKALALRMNIKSVLIGATGAATSVLLLYLF